MPANLDTIVQAYLDDEVSREEWESVIISREKSIPILKNIVASFTDGSIGIDTFRSEIDQALRATDNWGALGNWLQTLNKLNRNHGVQGEQGLRSALDGLDAK